MDKQWKAKWIEALRSGKYNQAREILYNGEGYCCLGILCDISGLGKWTEDREYINTFGDDSSLTTLPEFVFTAMGFYESNPIPLQGMNLDIRKGDGSLAELNDNGFTFSQIADIIEYFL